MKKILKSQRGIIMLNVIFLTLITALAATILFNAAPRIRNSQSTIRLTALYLAEEQIAQLESLAIKGEPLPTNFIGKPEDLKTKNFMKDDAPPIEFEVTTHINYDKNPREVTVKVSWTKKDFVEVKRMIYFVKKE